MSEDPRTKALLDKRCRVCKLQHKLLREAEKAKRAAIKQRLMKLGVEAGAKSPQIVEPHGDPYVEDPRDSRRRPRSEYGGSWW